MKCTELREALLAEPTRTSAEMDAHLVTCPECSAFVAELNAFEATLKRAMTIPVPARALPTLAELNAVAAPTPITAARRVRRMPVWLAIAASGVLVAVLVGTFLTVYPRNALASALVGHVRGEPASWAVTDVRVEGTAVAYVLSRSGVVIAAGGPPITYAQSCTFRGWHVPHLVVQTDHGPMTVMPLKHEHVSRPTTIDEDGYRGVIVPVGKGAVAVLAQGNADAAVLEAAAAQASERIHFTE